MTKPISGYVAQAFGRPTRMQADHLALLATDGPMCVSTMAFELGGKSTAKAAMMIRLNQSGWVHRAGLGVQGEPYIWTVTDEGRRALLRQRHHALVRAQDEATKARRPRQQRQTAARLVVARRELKAAEAAQPKETADAAP